jgi:deoxyribose-phosphate aldolase
LTRREVAKLIDNTMLRPTATRAEIAQFCEQSLESHFAAVCIFPFWVPLAVKILGESDVKVCTPIGFPFGMNNTGVKVMEARNAVSQGAREIDVVINLGALRSGEESVVHRDLQEVVKAVKLAGVTENGEEPIIKAILETCYLTEEEKKSACQLAVQAGAGFVKTSTGFGPMGATAEDVRLLRRTVGKEIGVKAAGGIRTWEQAQTLLNAGATRLGTSHGLAILEQVGEEGAEEL